MDTTIQISGELLERLKRMKLHNRESYENIIWDLIEDRLELSKKTKKRLVEYEKDKRNGKLKLKTLEQVKKELGF